MRLVLEARREGVNEILAKPVSIEAIYSRIRAITDAAAPGRGSTAAI